MNNEKYPEEVTNSTRQVHRSFGTKSACLQDDKGLSNLDKCEKRDCSLLSSSADRRIKGADVRHHVGIQESPAPPVA